MIDTSTMPRLAAEDIQAMPEAEWEALFDRISRGNDVYLITEKGEPRGVVFIPLHVLVTIIQTVTGSPLPVVEATGEQRQAYTDIFRDLARAGTKETHRPGCDEPSR